MMLDEAKKTIEALMDEGVKLVEVELMLTPKELQLFANYCIQNDIKFNDWMRKLAHENLEHVTRETQAL